MSAWIIALMLMVPAGQGPKRLEVPDEIKPPLVVLEGTVIPVSLVTEISTKHAEEGDGSYARTIFPITVDNEIVIPVNSYVRGRIVHATRPGRIKGRAELTINFHTIILPSGITLPLFGSLQAVGYAPLPFSQCGDDGWPHKLHAKPHEQHQRDGLAE